MVRITGSKEELDKIQVVLEDNPEWLADVQIDFQPNKVHAEVHKSDDHEKDNPRKHIPTCTLTLSW